MLHLVFAHRDKVRVVQQDVRGHQHGVGEEPGVHIAQPVLLVLEAVRQRHARVREETLQVPGQLGALRHVALAVEHGALGVQPKRHPRRGHGVSVFSQGGAVLDLGQGVQVRDEQERVVGAFVRQFNGRLDRPQDVAEVRGAGALDACQNACHGEGFSRTRRTPFSGGRRSFLRCGLRCGGAPPWLPSGRP